MIITLILIIILPLIPIELHAETKRGSKFFVSRRIRFENDGQEILVGRNQNGDNLENTGLFDCRVLSRKHAFMIFSRGYFYVKDLDSSNGTFLNGKRIFPRVPYKLSSLDIIQFGQVLTYICNYIVHCSKF